MIFKFLVSISKIFDTSKKEQTQINLVFINIQDSDVDAKKTDAIVEDDPHQSDADEDVVEEERPSKADLEGPGDADNVEAEPVSSAEQVRNFINIHESYPRGSQQ